MSIPKLIHYCWFGPDPIPQRDLDFIQEWSQINPDFTVIFWNEDNFDVNCSIYSRLAYAEKQWVALSAFARICVLCKYGGVYLDTDMMLLKPLRLACLQDSFFAGFKSETRVSASIIGSIPKHTLLRDMLAWYQDNPGSYLSCAALLTATLRYRFGLKENGQLQLFDEGIRIYPIHVFYPPVNLQTGKLELQDDTISLNHANFTLKSSSLIKQLFSHYHGISKGLDK